MSEDQKQQPDQDEFDTNETLAQQEDVSQPQPDAGIHKDSESDAGMRSGTTQSGATVEANADAANEGDLSLADEIEELAATAADLDPRDAEIAQLKDDLARARADLYNLQNEYGNYVRRAKAEAPTLRAHGHSEVVEALLSVFDDIHAAREHDDLHGPFEAIAEKLENTLRSRFEFERYGEAGEEFDPHRHEALMAQVNADVEVATVGQVLQPGYLMGERVLRAAKVMVHNPE